jgi:hypothetical protein
MAADNVNGGSIELLDVTKDLVVSKLPLGHLKFMPRKGERILISVTGQSDWRSYTIVDVEYFFSYNPVTGTPETPSQAGKITLYVEPSEKKSD